MRWLVNLTFQDMSVLPVFPARAATRTVDSCVAESHGYVTFIRKSVSFVGFLNLRLTGRIFCSYVLFQLTGACAVTADKLCDSRSRRSMATGPIGTQGDPCGSPQWPQRYCLVPRRPITGIRPARGGEQPSRLPIPDPVSAHCHGVCGTRSSDGRNHIAPVPGIRSLQIRWAERLFCCSQPASASQQRLLVSQDNRRSE